VVGANGNADPRGGDGNGPRPRRVRTGALSPREREVFELLAAGLSGAQIADHLVLSPETVRTHIRNGMARLGASTRSHAVAIALRRREIAPPDDAEDLAAPVPEPAAQAPRPLPAPGSVADPLSAVMDGLLDLFDVDSGWIYLADDGGLTLTQAVERVGDGSARMPKAIPLGEGPLGAAALERRAQVVQAPQAETGAMVTAPLLDGGRLVGILGLTVRSSRATGRQELLLLQALAARLAELTVSGGERMGPLALEALAGFRSSWATATRTG
jgi:DNA-binding CsgD family transcriptional regulator